MEVRIFATVVGLKMIYPEYSNKTEGGIRSASKSGIIGENCYSISINNLIKISKYVDIFDSLGRPGFLQIMVGLKFGENQNGINIFNLLNELNILFKEKYLDKDNTINLEHFQNNIEELEDTIRKFSFYENLNHDNPILFKNENLNKAHIYYKCKDDLIKYFDQPKQIEYFEFDTIYLIHESERLPEVNPLHQFLNYDEATGTDLTNVVDLDNVEYKIIASYDLDFEYSIHVKKQDREEDKHNGDFLRIKDKITISFKKPYYIEKTIHCSLNDGSLKNYLLIDDNERTLKIIKSPELNHKKEKLEITIVNNCSKGSLPKNLKVKLVSISSGKEIPLNTNIVICDFWGEEWGEKWKIEIDNTKLFNQSFELVDSYKTTFVPKNQGQQMSISLKEKRTYAFEFFSGNAKLDNVQINPKDRYIEVNSNIITLVDKYIYDKHRLQFSKSGYQNQKITFDPIHPETQFSLNPEVQVDDSKQKGTSKTIDKVFKYIVLPFVVLMAISLGLNEFYGSPFYLLGKTANKINSLINHYTGHSPKGNTGINTEGYHGDSVSDLTSTANKPNSNTIDSNKKDNQNLVKGDSNLSLSLTNNKPNSNISPVTDINNKPGDSHSERNITKEAPKGVEAPTNNNPQQEKKYEMKQFILDAVGADSAGMVKLNSKVISLKKSKSKDSMLNALKNIYADKDYFSKHKKDKKEVINKVN